ncbi:hypothetical protein [Bacillus sp. RC242]|uniref:hypothetical protein n=1 Tax=Bacillus sp. RC242 TaxID=3156286 RepID=UPI00384EEEF7
MFDWGFALEIPYEMLGVFSRHINTAAPISKLPLYGLAQFRFSNENREQLERLKDKIESKLPTVPLGVVGTDHVGYASFDLTPLRQMQLMQRFKQVLDEEKLFGAHTPRLTIQLGQLLVMPFKDQSIAFDAIAEGDLGPDYISLRMDLDEIQLANRTEWSPMPSMQTPGIRDWRLSPGSFSMASTLLIGEDGCETLLPSNLATRLIRFQQIVRSSKTAYANQSDRSETNAIPGLGTGFDRKVRLGYVVQLHTEWFPLGHSLGQIAYSVPLAPGEKTLIAIVDWSRRDVAKRTEQTTETEDLNHATYRDRSLSEAVNMLVRESQKGSSFMAGGSLSAGAGIPIGPVSLGLGTAIGIGGASSKSEGMRSLISDTTQNISDAFHQASSVARELTSTVVVQGQQAESATAKTRVIANYNHSHALTILYYEVLQHHRLVTRATSVRPVLMLKHKVKPFNYDGDEVYILEKYRDVIAANLLDESLRPCLSVLSKRVCLQVKADYENAKVEKKPLHMLGEFSIDFVTGIYGPATYVHVKILPKYGPPVICDVVDVQFAATLFGNIYRNAVDPLQIPANAGTTIKFRPRNYHLRWTNVQAIEIHQGPIGNEHTTFNNVQEWDLREIHVKTVAAGDTWNMYDSFDQIKISFLGQPETFEVVPYEESITIDPDDSLTDDERCCHTS